MIDSNLLRLQLVLSLCLIVILSTEAAEPPSNDVGEFSVPEVIPLRPNQIERLRELIRTDAEAKKRAEEVREQAIPLLDMKPQPLEVIHYEGLVNTDLRRVATVERLRQLGDAAMLVRYWQATGNPQAAATLKSLILAWANRYRPTGNDVNENKLYPLLVAYEALRDEFSADEQQRVDDWVERIGSLHAKSVEGSTHFTNRYSKHLRLLAVCGMILQRDDWVQDAREGVKRFVRESLRSDGTSLDLERRDSLGYHGSALRPPMQLAMLAGDEGRELYDWTSEEGGSLKKSVDYLVPYAMGEKVHREWVDTKVDLDRRRAAAGLEKYRPGKPYDPQDALEVMETASYFDPDLMRVVRHLNDSRDTRFPTWTTLINAAAAPNVDNETDADARRDSQE